MDTRTRYLIIALIVLAVIIVALLGYIFLRSTTSPSPTATTTPVTVTSTTTQTLPTAQANHIKESGKYYDIDMQYPSSTSLAQTAGASANAAAITAMKGFSQNTIDAFKQNNNVDHISAADAEQYGLTDGRSYALSSEYGVYSGPHTISYDYTLYEDTLGAHPNSYFRTFTFDQKSGRALELGDLFTSNADYLSVLSAASRKSLTSQLGSNGDPDMIKGGTTPDADNFQNFYIDGSNLVIEFPPYQVAAYAVGPQQVEIPLSQLKNILKTQYQ